MLASQQLLLYYIFAVHDMGWKNIPLMIDGESVFNMAPCSINGNECSSVYEWCKGQYRTSAFWAELKVPGRLSFMRLLAKYNISKKDSWPVINDKLPTAAHDHMLEVRQNCNDLIDEIRVQLVKCRKNKEKVVENRFRAKNKSLNEPAQVDTL
jgi:hypothetical protein